MSTPAVQASVKACQTAIKAGDFAAAKDAAEGGLAAAADNIDLLLLAAFASSNLNRLPDAKQYLTRALKADPTNAQAKQGLLDVFKKTDDWDGQISMLASLRTDAGELAGSKGLARIADIDARAAAAAYGAALAQSTSSADSVDGKPALHVLHLDRAVSSVSSCLDSLQRAIPSGGDDGGFTLDPLRARALQLKAHLTLPILIEARIVLAVPSANHFSTAGTPGAGPGIDPGPPSLPPLIHRLVAHGPQLVAAYGSALRALLRIDSAGSAAVSIADTLGCAPALSSLPPAVSRECISILRRAVGYGLDMVKIGWAGAEGVLSRTHAAEGQLKETCTAVITWCLGVATAGKALQVPRADIESGLTALSSSPDRIGGLGLLAVACEAGLAWCWSTMTAPETTLTLHCLEYAHSKLGSTSPITAMSKVMLSAAQAAAVTVEQPGTTAAKAQEARYQALKAHLQEAQSVLSSFPSAVASGLPWLSSSVAALHLGCARTCPSPPARISHSANACSVMKGLLVSMGAGPILQQCNVAVDAGSGLNMSTSALGIRKPEAWTGATVHGMVLGTAAAVLTSPAPLTEPTAPKMPAIHADVSLFSVGAWLPTKASPLPALPIVDAAPLAGGAGKQGKGQAVAPLATPAVTSATDADVLSEAMSAQAARMAAAGASSAGHRNAQFCLARLYGKGVTPSVGVLKALSLLCVALSTVPDLAGPQSRECVALASVVYPWLRDAALDAASCGLKQLAADLWALASKVSISACRVLTSRLPCGVSSASTHVVGPGCLFVLTTVPPSRPCVQETNAWLNQAREAKEAYLSHADAGTATSNDLALSLSSLYCLLSILVEGITMEDKEARLQALHRSTAAAKEGRKSGAATSCMPWMFWCAAMSTAAAAGFASGEYGPLACLDAGDDTGLSQAYYTAALAAWCTTSRPTSAAVQPSLLSALAYDPANASAWALIGALFACPQRHDDTLCPVGAKGKQTSAAAEHGSPRNATRARACLSKALELSPSHDVAGPLVIDALLPSSVAEDGAAGSKLGATFAPDLLKAKALAHAACTDSNAPWAHWRAAALCYAEGMQALALAGEARAAAADSQHATTCLQSFSENAFSQDVLDSVSIRCDGHLDTARIQKAAAEASFLSCCSHYDRAVSGVVKDKDKLEPRLRDFLPSITARITRPDAWNETEADTYIACWSGLAACYSAQGRPAAAQAAASSAMQAASVFSEAWKTEQVAVSKRTAQESFRLAPASVQHLCRALLGGAMESLSSSGQRAIGQQVLHWLSFVPPALLLQLANAERTLGNYENALILCQICMDSRANGATHEDVGGGVQYCMGSAHRAMARRLLGDGLVGEGVQHAVAGAQAASVGLEALQHTSKQDLTTLPFLKLRSDCHSILYDACPWAVHPVAMLVACGKAEEAGKLAEAVEPEEIPVQSWIKAMRIALSNRCQAVLLPSSSTAEKRERQSQGHAPGLASFSSWLLQSLGLAGNAVAKALSLIPSITHAALPSACLGARALSLGSNPTLWAALVGSWLASLQASLEVVQAYMTALESDATRDQPYLLPALCTALCDTGRLLYMGQQTCIQACGSTGAGLGYSSASEGPRSTMTAIFEHAAHLRRLSALVHSLACTVDPCNPRAWNGLGCTEAVPGRAQHALIRAVATGGGGIPLVNLGALYLSLGALDTARAVLLQAQTQDPSNESMWLTLGALADGSTWVKVLAGQASAGSSHAGDAYVLATQLTLHSSATLPAALHGLGLLPWQAEGEAAQAFTTPLAWTLAQQAVESDPCNPLAWLAFCTARADSACEGTSAALWPEWPTIGARELELVAQPFLGRGRVVGRLLQPLQIGKLFAFLTSFKHRTSVSIQAPAARSAARAWSAVHAISQSASARTRYLQEAVAGTQAQGDILAALDVVSNTAQLYEVVCLHYSGQRPGDGSPGVAGLQAWATTVQDIKASIIRLMDRVGVDATDEVVQAYYRLDEPSLVTAAAPGPVDDLQAGLAALTTAASSCASKLSLHQDSVSDEWMQEVTSWGFEYGLLASLCSALGLSPLHSYALALAAQSGVLPGDEALLEQVKAAQAKAGTAGQATRTAQTHAKYESRMSMGAFVSRPDAISGTDSPLPVGGESAPLGTWRTPALASSVSTIAQQVQAAGALVLALGGVGGYDAVALRKASARAALSLQQQL